MNNTYIDGGDGQHGECQEITSVLCCGWANRTYTTPGTGNYMREVTLPYMPITFISQLYVTSVQYVICLKTHYHSFMQYMHNNEYIRIIT